MAQAVRHDEAELELLLSQVNEKAALFQTVAYGQMNTGDHRVHARQLIYDPPQCWAITQLYAVFIGSTKLSVRGEYSAQNLENLFYVMSFEVMLTDSCNINDVELKLTLPDKSVKTQKVCLTDYPRNKRISLKADKAMFLNLFESGNIKFELNGTELATKKKGLVIFDVVFRRVIDPKANA